MVHVTQQRLEIPSQKPAGTTDIGLMDPSIVFAAREIYRIYRETHPTRTQPPLGVAVNQYTLRGKLILNRKPILLPQERFVPFTQLEEAS
ncbi:hypothetical protein BST81_21025 [Leptolyngbya sp. 'hensonii']|uniref:hypothetical protein n=1 Tax=Leptolyngbya sp. 'hensonii' TaxID=1922337 RepID=UPI00095026A1|nr:hypothetical protein [Leptolyngbya sp. 'hensonii']OLP16464.1 hypothetical protein BST81_21025 [Leptolyngbya sp. 'hensonii']